MTHPSKADRKAAHKARMTAKRGARGDVEGERVRISTETLHEVCADLSRQAEALLGDERLETVRRICRIARQLAGGVYKSVGSCVHEAQIVTALLREAGFDAHTVPGECVWRVGNGNADTIAHAAGAGGGAGNFYGHCWSVIVGLGNPIRVDSTLATLPEKARLGDLADGHTTKLTWAPEMLIAMAAESPDVSFAAQARRAGAWTYRTDTSLAYGLRDKVDPMLIEMGRRMLKGDDMTFFALNDENEPVTFRSGQHEETI